MRTIVTLSLVTLLACSSSSKSSGHPSQDAGGTPPAADSSVPSCVCSITNNGVSQNLACGQSACVNGTEFSCSAGASITQGSSCTTMMTTPDSSSGPAPDSAATPPDSSSGCSLFACQTTSDCGGIAPCMSTATAGTNYCYEQEASASACSSGTTPTSATVNGMQDTLCVPAGCPQPVMWLQ